MLRKVTSVISGLMKIWTQVIHIPFALKMFFLYSDKMLYPQIYKHMHTFKKNISLQK